MNPVIYIVLSVCLHGACHEVNGGPLQGSPLVGCVIEGQTAAIVWLEQHPAYELGGWQCRANDVPPPGDTDI